MEALRGILPYLLPPLLGAIIGYLTNAVAIRMLFRPLTEKRLFGIRIPFTPGIIPRKRHQLSESIAQMVSTKLLTEETIRQKFDDPSFRDNLLHSVGKFTHELLHRNPRDRDPQERDAVGDVEELVRSLLGGFFRSAPFHDAARTIVVAAINGATHLTVERIAPSEQTISGLVSSGLGALSEGDTGKAVEQAVAHWAEEHAKSDTPLGVVVGPHTVSRISEILPQVYEPLMESIFGFLNTKETKHELAIHGRGLLNQILRRLNLLQRLFVSAGQYDRNLSESMPAIVEDVIASIEKAGRNPANRDELIASFRAKLLELGDTGIGSLGTSLSVDLPETGRKAVRAVLELLGREDVRERVVSSVLTFLQRHGDAELGQLLRDVVGVDPEGLRDAAIKALDQWLSRETSGDEITEVVMSFAGDFIAADQNRPLSELLPLSDDQKTRVDAFITAKLFDQIERRVPELMAGLDIHGMVVAKIDGLDILSVEQLLLMVISKHLKWINLFGGIIGAFIGGIQVLISRFV